MAELIPSLIWYNEKIVPWEKATVHVWSELAIRGTSVFEGLRAYWNGSDNKYYILSLDDHMRRFAQSARLLWIPCTQELIKKFRKGIFELILALNFCEHCYIRPTIFIQSGRYGYKPEEVTLGSYIVVFPVPRPQLTTVGSRACVSSWRRLTDSTLPPRIKAGAAYTAFRMPTIEAKRKGVNEAILLNERNKVAETPGSAIFIIRDGQVITPPVTAGILESITRKNTIELLKIEFNLEVIEREVDRTELYIADEIFTCGTLSEIQPVIEVDDIKIGNGEPGSLTCKFRDRYFQICDSGSKAPYNWLTPVVL
ncbi:MAG: aminotransferase class IV [bacterium]